MEQCEVVDKKSSRADDSSRRPRTHAGKRRTRRVAAECSNGDENRQSDRSNAKGVQRPAGEPAQDASAQKAGKWRRLATAPARLSGHEARDHQRRRRQIVVKIEGVPKKR